MQIKHFVDPLDRRTHLQQPFIHQNKTVATDGGALVFAPPNKDYSLLPEAYRERAHASLDSVAKDITQCVAWRSLPDMSNLKKVVCLTCDGNKKASRAQCPECKGEGVIEFRTSHNEYEPQCITCEGEGKTVFVGGNDDCPDCLGTGVVYQDYSIEINGLRFQTKYLRLINDADYLKISILHDKSMLIFGLMHQEQEYTGVIMACRR